MRRVKLHATCMICKATPHVHVEQGDLEKYRSGELVQTVWPMGETWFREVIIGNRTGVFMCKSCTEAEIEEHESLGGVA